MEHSPLRPEGAWQIKSRWKLKHIAHETGDALRGLEEEGGAGVAMGGNVTMNHSQTGGLPPTSERVAAPPKALGREIPETATRGGDDPSANATVRNLGETQDGLARAIAFSVSQTTQCSTAHMTAKSCAIRCSSCTGASSSSLMFSLSRNSTSWNDVSVRLRLISDAVATSSLGLCEEVVDSLSAQGILVSVFFQECIIPTSSDQKLLAAICHLSLSPRSGGDIRRERESGDAHK